MNLASVAQVAIGAIGGAVASVAWLTSRAKAEGGALAKADALAVRVHALEAQHAELLRHVNERATKSDVEAMARNIITQMDSRFANLIALMTSRGVS